MEKIDPLLVVDAGRVRGLRLSERVVSQQRLVERRGDRDGEGRQREDDDRDVNGSTRAEAAESGHVLTTTATCPSTRGTR
jgi:hypothetical protein